MPLNIQPIPAAAGGVWNGIPTTCHMATLYWIHRSELRTLATQNDYLNAFLNPTAVMTGMLAFGRRLSKPMIGNINLTPGSVIIFAKNGQALHSCVARNHNTIAGYNQVNWFTSAGVNHGHSTHSVADIKWTGMTNNQVDGNTANNSPCQLIAVPENAAKAHVRQHVQ
jgi:hypothetical protein